MEKLKQSESEVPMSSSRQLSEDTLTVDPKAVAADMVSVRKYRMWFYVIAMSLGTLQTGWAITGNTQTGLILVAKFGWNDSETKLYNSILTNISLIGIMVGAIAGGPIISAGRRRAIFIMAAATIIGVVLTLILTLPTMVVGRFITGFAGGVYQLCGIKAVQETVPGNLIGLYGTSTQIILSLGCFTVTTIGWLSLPEDQENYSQDEWWRLSYGFPLILLLVQVLFLLTSWKYEPIDFLIRLNRDEEALKFLPLVFVPKEPNHERQFRRYVELRRSELIQNQQQVRKVSFKEALFSERYWRATWVGFGLSVANQFTAIGPVFIFSNILLQKIEVETEGSFLISIKSGVMIVVAVAVFGSFGGMAFSRYFGRKSILVASQIGMTIVHAIIAILYNQEQYAAMYTFILIFILLFNGGSGNVTFIILGEVCIDTALGFVFGAMWLTEVLMTFTISYMIDSKLGVEYTFGIYAGLNLIASLFDIFLVKETRGKSAIQLEELYIRKLSSKVQVEMGAE